MKKADTIQKIQGHGTDASFVLNVVMNHHRKPAVMILGLANLLEAGHEVRTGQFDLDVLVIDGCAAPWNVLREWSTRHA